MTAEQLIEWGEYAGLEPFGGYAEEARFAKLTAFVGNTAIGFGAKRDGGGRFKPAEFMPQEQDEGPKRMEDADPDGANARGLANLLAGLAKKKKP